MLSEFAMSPTLQVLRDAGMVGSATNNDKRYAV